MARSASVLVVLLVALLAVLIQPASAQAPVGTQSRNITIPTQSSIVSSSSVAPSSSLAANSSGSIAPTAIGNSTAGGPSAAANSTRTNTNSSSTSSSASSTAPKPTATFSPQSGQAPAPAAGGGGNVAQSPDDSYIASAQRNAVLGLVTLVSLAGSLAWVTL